MTTKDSPVDKIKAQADKIALLLKNIERGIPILGHDAKKIEEAKKREFFKFAIIMDDKTISIEIPWVVIRANNENQLSEWIMYFMQEKLKQ